MNDTAGSGGQRAPRPPAAARRRHLRALIAERGFLSVADMARRLGVSEMTIRRDLSVLEADGSLLRTHGGAVLVQGEAPMPVDLHEPAFEARSRRRAGAKRAIARAAAALLRPGATIGLDVGTTTFELARRLAEMRDLKIFTNSLRAAGLLANAAHDVYLPGGRVRGTELSLCGPVAVRELGNYWLDYAFLGVSGITAAGCFDYSLEDTEIKTVYIARAAHVVVLCDSSKFARMSVVKVCDLERVDRLITDAPPPPPLARALEAAGVELVLAEMREIEERA